jgi:hypothetical protein
MRFKDTLDDLDAQMGALLAGAANPAPRIDAAPGTKA